MKYFFVVEHFKNMLVIFNYKSDSSEPCMNCDILHFSLTKELCFFDDKRNILASRICSICWHGSFLTYGLFKQAMPDSIAGLQKLEELDVSSNLLQSLPDSIGLLLNLKVLNVSGNKLNTLPESIARCRYFIMICSSTDFLSKSICWSWGTYIFLFLEVSLCLFLTIGC